MDDLNKTIIFENRSLIFVFNFHSDHSIPDYQFQVPESGDYRSVLNTDNVKFGGQGRVDETKKHTTRFHPETNTHWLSIYNTNRTAQVFQRIY